MTAPLMLSEAHYLHRIVDYAVLRGWRYAHFQPAQRGNGRWVTPMQGHVGFPDLVFARDGVVLLREVKAQQGRASPEQRHWLTALGEHGGLWKPSDWRAVQEALR